MGEKVKSVCVYCASRKGTNPEFMNSAKRLGTLIAENDFTLVYGGSVVGLMGTVADAALAAKGKVIGIIPQIVIDYNEPVHEGLTEKYLVKNMSERKQLMEDKSDAFIVMPGGYGTMDELFQVMILKALGDNDKPIIIVNIEGFYEPLFKLIDHFLENELISADYKEVYKVVASVEEAVAALKQ